VTENKSIENYTALLLRWGVSLAGVLMLVGWAGMTNWNEPIFNDLSQYDPIPLKKLLVHYFSKRNWFFLIGYLGLAVLIIIPFIRVLLLIILFLKNREFLLSLISMMVFMGLVVSLLV
jgi:uncharacterized membrane protein